MKWVYGLPLEKSTNVHGISDEDSYNGPMFPWSKTALYEINNGCYSIASTVPYIFIITDVYRILALVT